MYNSAKEHRDFFNRWKDYVFAMSAIPQDSQGVQLHFANVELLGLLQNKAISNSCDIMKDILNMHSNKIKILLPNSCLTVAVH